jgi:MFS family permease
LFPRWYQVVVGRVIDDLSIGALSVIVPMYQGESSPTHVRGAIVCCYQLFITIGILIAYLINFGTESIQSPASWRIVMGISFIWAFVLGFGHSPVPRDSAIRLPTGEDRESRGKYQQVLWHWGKPRCWKTNEGNGREVPGRAGGRRPPVVRSIHRPSNAL